MPLKQPFGPPVTDVSPLTAHPASRLAGRLRPPGDKSISHRALLLGALATGETRITGLLEGEDVHATAAALRALGTDIEAADGVWRVRGAGVGGLDAPAQVLDMGNSGTGARLMMGVLASHDFLCHITGDASLTARPMGRVITPLSQMGADIRAREGGRLPLTIQGAEFPIPITYELPVASAQVKSAILLAGLNTAGETTVIEPSPTRDHTERMLQRFGASLDIAQEGAGKRITLQGYPELAGQELAVPADPSSAAFALVAGLIVPGSEVTVTDLCLNPLRTGLLDCLREMGAEIEVTNARDEAGEPAGDVTARASGLKGIVVPAVRAPSMIDEYPILAAAAACASGTSRFEGVGELRVKESDRLAAVVDGLRRCGVAVESGEDWMEIEGCAGPPPGLAGDAPVETYLDHRIAMSFLVLGLASQKAVTVDDGAMIATSYPAFGDQMAALGAEIG